MDVYFGNDDYYKIIRKDGLIYITLQVLHKDSSACGTDISFILDTGAYMTVISRSTAILCGFDKMNKRASTLFGFSGGISVDYVRIPALIILGKLYMNVPVLIPHNTHRILPETGEKKPLPDVLGLNILEYFNYYVDTGNDRLYLKTNLTPRFYSPELASGQILSVSSK